MKSSDGCEPGVTEQPCEVRPDERAMSRAENHRDSFALLQAEQKKRRQHLPESADFNRLPLWWYKAKARQMKEAARARGVDGGILLTNRWNIIYATGLLHSTTERPFACFLPMDDDDGCIWFHPYLDESLVRDWWCTDSFSYFDYHQSEGKAPNEGGTDQGRTVNVFRWWGETLAKLGYGDKTIGIDSGGLAEIGIMPGQERTDRLDMFAEIDVPTPYRPVGGTFGLMAEAIPEASFVDVYDILIRNRMVKDDMENALTQRAMDYFSEIHAFARNYMLEKGPGTLDWEVANAAAQWGMHRIMKDIPHQGRPHEAVGIEVRVGCRTGRATAYPHPNQVRWAEIERGHALQLAGVVRIGGYGGEQYRSFLFGPWSQWQERMWEVHTRSYFIQAEQTYAGNTCSNVAKAVLKYQIDNGCGHVIYHRPGHGEGMEGHQPPYQALGDYTVMQKGMHFSNEPGLYDPENGFGYNHGNNVLVSDDTGLQMGTAPADREWCLIEF